MKTKWIKQQEWNSYTIRGRSNDGATYLSANAADGLGPVWDMFLHPNSVRALRRMLAEREAELVAAGFLETEAEDE